MLLLQYASRKCRGIVVVANRYGRLDDDGAMVQRRRDEMHGAPMNLYPGGERPLVGIQAGERRQQRRMNINESPVVAVDKGAGQDPHESGEQHNIGCVPVNFRGQRGIETFPVGKRGVVQRDRRDLAGSRQSQRPRAGTIADDRGELGRNAGIQQCG